MSKSNDLAQAGAKLITLVTDAMMYAWRFFIEQTTILLSTRWDSIPVLKILLVVMLVAAIVSVVAYYISPLLQILASIGAAVSYVLAGFFAFGLVAALINWFVRTLPNVAFATG